MPGIAKPRLLSMPAVGKLSGGCLQGLIDSLQNFSRRLRFSASGRFVGLRSMQKASWLRGGEAGRCFFQSFVDRIQNFSRRLFRHSPALSIVVHRSASFLNDLEAATFVPVYRPPRWRSSLQRGCRTHRCSGAALRSPVENHRHWMPAGTRSRYMRPMTVSPSSAA